jgi:hypothetical protein
MVDMQSLTIVQNGKWKKQVDYQRLYGLRSTFVTKIRMQKILAILRLCWNPITLVLIWKVLRKGFSWYHCFRNPSTFGWVISQHIITQYIPSAPGYAKRLDQGTITNGPGVPAGAASHSILAKMVSSMPAVIQPTRHQSHFMLRVQQSC